MRHETTDSLALPESPVVVHLVHGTWARGVLRQVFGRWLAPPAPGTLWYDTESAFSADLRAMVGFPFEILSFNWSGANSARERAVAAWQLREHLREKIASRSGARHLIISHSHGGNVALRAVQMLPEASQKPGVATLASPFLLGRRVAVSKGQWRLLVAGALAPLWPLMLFGVGALLGGLIQTLGGNRVRVGEWLDGWGFAVGFVLIAQLIIWVTDRHRRRLGASSAKSAIKSAVWENAYSLTTLAFLRRVRRRERVLRMIEWSDPLVGRPLVLRARGDEAGIALWLAAVATALWSRPWRLLRSWAGFWRWRGITWWKRLKVMGAFVGLLFIALVFAPGLREGFAIVMYSLPIGIVVWAPAVVFPILLAAAALLLPFGRDLFRYPLTLQIIGAETPPGIPSSAVEVLRPALGDPPRSGLRHGMHGLLATRRRLAQWIVEERMCWNNANIGPPSQSP